MRFPIITDNVLGPIAAAETVVKWHTENYEYSRQDMLAEMAIDLHTQLRNLADDGDPRQIGSWHLMASLIDYTRAAGVDFAELVQDVGEYDESDPGPHIVQYKVRGGQGLNDDGKPAELGTWHLLASIASYLGSSEFKTVAADVVAEVDLHPSPNAGMGT